MAKAVNIAIPEDLFEAVDQQARLEDRPRGAIFREAVRMYLILTRRGVIRVDKRGDRLPPRTAEEVLSDNVIVINKSALARGLTEDDLLRIGQEVREELFQEQYGAKR